MLRSRLNISLLFFFFFTGFLSATTLTGLVKNANTSEPIAQAKVSVLSFSANDSLLLTTVTNATGRYELSVPAGLTVYITASAAGYQVQRLGPVRVDSLASVFNFNLLPEVLPYANRLAGAVVNDSTNQPVQGAKVYLGNSAGTVMFTYSDALGKYSFINIVPGTYQVKADKEGFVSAVYPQTFTITATSVFNEVIFRLRPAISLLSAKVTGRVIAAGTGGVPPLIGATVKFVSNNSTTAVTVPVDTLGNYVLNATPPGTYVITASAPRYVSVNKTVNLVTGLNTVSFELRRDTTVTGTNLFAGKAGDDSLNIPLGGVLVEMSPIGTLPYIVPAYTDSLGKFRFTNIPQGTYNIKATKAGYAPFTAAQPVVITATTVIENFAIRMVRSGGGTGTCSLGGVVLAATGAVIPVREAAVILSQSNGVSFVNYTDSLGAYRFPSVPAGTYSFVVNKTGYKSYTGSVVLTSGVYTKNVELLPVSNTVNGLVQGKVWFDGTEAPVKGAFVSFIPRASATGGVSVTAVTDSSGKFSAILQQGSYYAQVKYSRENVGYVYTEYFNNAPTIATATPVNIAGRDTVRGVNFGIPQLPVSSNHYIVVTGKVTDTLARPLANAKVQYYTRGLITPAVVQGTTTDANGNYAIVLQYVSADTARKSVAVSAVKEGYKIEFYNNKPALDFANWLPLLGDTVYTGIDFSLETIAPAAAYTISGSVKDTAGTFVPGASVIVINKANNQVVFASASVTGEYSAQVKQGSYLVLFTAPGFAPQFYNNAMTWEQATPVSVNANVTGINARLRRLNTPGTSGSLTGVVSSQQGTPVAGVLVGVLNSAGEMVGYDFTGDDGSYEVTGMIPGSYNVSVTHAQYSSVQMPIVYDPLTGSGAVVNMNLTQSPTEVEPGTGTTPKDYSLLSNYPNPFNPGTTVRFNLQQSSAVVLKVYDMTGREVVELLKTVLPAGEHTVKFDGTGLTSGTYICELRAANTIKRIKMLLLK